MVVIFEFGGEFNWEVENNGGVSLQSDHVDNNGGGVIFTASRCRQFKDASIVVTADAAALLVHNYFKDDQLYMILAILV